METETGAAADPLADPSARPETGAAQSAIPAIEPEEVREPVTFLEKLAADPTKFGFLQSMRQLEAMHPELPRLGTSLRPSDDPVRLGQEPSVVFATSTLASFEPSGFANRPVMEVLFLGLFGPNGPLPLHLTEYARDRLIHEDDPTFKRFADVFHHRLLLLFYRAWATSSPAASYDRPDMNRFEDFIGSLVGIGAGSLKQRDDMPDLAKLYYSGRLSNKTNNAEGLQAILSDFFKLPVQLEQFVGHWLELPDNALCRLGSDPEVGTLGMNVMVGTHFWDCQQAFRIVFGPLDLQDYLRLLPSGDTMTRVSAIVRNYIGDAMLWDLNLVLKKEEVPPLRLGEFGELGWSTWLCDRNEDRDVTDLVLQPSENLG